MNYAKLAFTDAIKSLQSENGSRKGYEKMEQFVLPDGLSYRELEFIQARDSFYVASLGENGYPYIQHRGGPKGFLKVLDPKTLGFLDFRGNKQYITTGNVKTHNKVSLILMDYVNRQRLKIYADAEVVSAKERSDLWEQLQLEGYQYKAERLFVFHIKAYDWNCPQHITPRYTESEIQEMLVAYKNEIVRLKQELAGKTGIQ